MEHKLAYSIKKYNQETKKTSFIKDVSDINSQNILFKIDNFTLDFEMENDIKISLSKEKFRKIYNRKISPLSNENFILTFSILDDNFFKSIDLNLFQNHIYNTLYNYFDILSFLVIKDAIGDITFYFICTAITKEIFLDHILKKVNKSDKSLEDLSGVLNFNLILGGTKGENPESKFINIVCNKLNHVGNYRLTPASEGAKQQYILDSYNRAAAKINNIYKDLDNLIENLIADNPKFGPYIDNIIDKNNLNTLKR